MGRAAEASAKDWRRRWRMNGAPRPTPCAPMATMWRVSWAFSAAIWAARSVKSAGQTHARRHPRLHHRAPRGRPGRAAACSGRWRRCEVSIDFSPRKAFWKMPPPAPSARRGCKRGLPRPLAEDDAARAIDEAGEQMWNGWARAMRRCSRFSMARACASPRRCGSSAATCRWARPSPSWARAARSACAGAAAAARGDRRLCGENSL